ncbi:MAG: hypothetical protein HFH84_03410 [Lachnospiraceae bacterium]|nr:hypothetical protein [Lachnospiraceae bacterium]
MSKRLCLSEEAGILYDGTAGSLKCVNATVEGAILHDGAAGRVEAWSATSFACKELYRLFPHSS